MPNAKVRFVTLYTAGVAILVFVINRVFLGTIMQTSLLWAALFAAIPFSMAWPPAHHRWL